MKQFDYYIYIDYSENLIGYCIIEGKRVKELLPKIAALQHYRELKKRKAYLRSIKKLLKRNNIEPFLFKLKIRELRRSVEVYSDIFAFLTKNESCTIFISIDNNQYHSFLHFATLFDKQRVTVVKESDLHRGTLEYRLSLIIDTLLNLERIKK